MNCINKMVVQLISGALSKQHPEHLYHSTRVEYYSSNFFDFISYKLSSSSVLLIMNCINNGGLVYVYYKIVYRITFIFNLKVMLHTHHNSINWGN